MTGTIISKKRLGIPGALFLSPLTTTLRRREGFMLTVDAPARNALRLRGHDLDAALLSPIDFAREGSLYRVVPGVAASSQSANSAITLHFREGLHDIATLAADPAVTSEIVLAKIILAEEFDVSPKIVPFQGPLDAMLGKADAALLAGDASLRETAVRHNVVDLVEAWGEMTDLPFAHCFWCAREEDLTEEEAKTLRQAGEEGTSLIDEIAADASSHAHSSIPVAALKAHLETFSYDFSDEAQEGLKEFLRYAYYHAILPDVPDIRWFGESSEEED
jgi:chorismate dehydratase